MKYEHSLNSFQDCNEEIIIVYLIANKMSVYHYNIYVNEI
jgi:hypothetical protein